MDEVAQEVVVREECYESDLALLIPSQFLAIRANMHREQLRYFLYAHMRPVFFIEHMSGGSKRHILILLYMQYNLLQILACI